MTQKYGEDKVFAPGTVIISAAGGVSNVRKIVSPVIRNVKKSSLYRVDFSGCSLRLGGSALNQALNALGASVPTVASAEKFAAAFNAVQKLVKRGSILALHDISAGGMITALLEMTFANVNGGLEISTESFTQNGENDILKILFAENPAVLMQIADDKAESALKLLTEAGVEVAKIGRPTETRTVTVNHSGNVFNFDIDALRDVWFRTSYLLDRLQSGEKCAELRYSNFSKQPIRYRIPASFNGKLASRGLALGRHKTK